MFATIFIMCLFVNFDFGLRLTVSEETVQVNAASCHIVLLVAMGRECHESLFCTATIKNESKIYD